MAPDIAATARPKRQEDEGGPLVLALLFPSVLTYDGLVGTDADSRERSNRLEVPGKQRFSSGNSLPDSTMAPSFRICHRRFRFKAAGMQFQNLR